jgi:hypothetical protein
MSCAGLIVSMDRSPTSFADELRRMAKENQAQAATDIGDDQRGSLNSRQSELIGSGSRSVAYPAGPSIFHIPVAMPLDLTLAFGT